MILPLPPETTALLCAFPIPCLLLDHEGKVLFANPSTQDTLQWSNKALQGGGLSVLFPGAQSLDRVFKATENTPAAVRVPEIEVICPDGGAIVVAAHISPYGQGGWLLVLTPLIQMGQGARSDALKTRAGSLSAMAGMLAHEIKNPLAAIRGAAQLIPDQPMSDHKSELAELIVGETRRISKLLDTMELFSSPEDLDVGPVNIHEVLGEVIKTARLSFGTHITFIEDYDPSLPKVQANAHVLHRVFLNLVKNACEACADKRGQVRLKTRFHLAERRRVQADETKANLPIRVSFIDNGGGIAAEVRDKLFDAFISTKDQGRGLGLSYVAGAVAAMDGDIDVGARPGVTQFQLRLPQASVKKP